MGRPIAALLRLTVTLSLIVGLTAQSPSDSVFAEDTAPTTATITTTFSEPPVVDLHYTVEAKGADASWSVVSTAVGKGMVIATLPVGSICRIRIDDPTGYYRSGYVANGGYHVDFVDLAEDAEEIELTESGELPLEMQGGGRIVGTLFDDQGQRLEGVPVHAHGGQWPPRIVGTGTTDANGTFSIDRLFPGDYRMYMMVDPQGRIAHTQWITGSGEYLHGEEITVPRGPEIASFEATMLAGGSISGTVRRDIDGVGVSGMPIECYADTRPDGGLRLVDTTTTEPDGSYTLKGMNDNVYMICFGPDWTGPETPRDFYSVPGNAAVERSFDVTLTTLAIIKGSAIVTPTWEWSEAPYGPFAKALLNLQANCLDPATGIYQPVLSGNESWSGNYIDVEGDFYFRIRPGDYRMTFTGNNAISHDVPPTPGYSNIHVTAGQELDLGAFVVNRTTIIRGQATKEFFTAPENIDTSFTLWKKQPDGSFIAVATQNAIKNTGLFRFAGDYTGTFRITGSTTTPGYRGWSYPNGTDVATGEDIIVERSEFRALDAGTMTSHRGWVQGVVRGLQLNANGDAITAVLPGVSITAYQKAATGLKHMGTVTSGQDGTFSAQLPVGDYTFTLVDSAGLYSTAKFGVSGVPLTVVTEQVTELGDFTLPRRGRIGGWVTSSATGGPISGASVTLSRASGTTAPRITDSSGYFESADIDWDAWNFRLTDSAGRFESLVDVDTCYSGIGSTELVELQMDPLGPQIERAAGADRYSTCADAISKSFAYADEIIIATGAAFPDALAGAPLATALDAPLLLVKRDSIPAPIENEIRRLRPTAVTVLGGTASVSETVVDRLVSLGIPRANIQRIAGADRYETAANISLEVYELYGWTPQDRISAYVASGQSFADALSASSVAAAQGRPLLLVSGTGVPSSTARALASIRPAATLVIGGERAIAPAVMARLPDARRIAGTSRYHTNALLLTEAMSEASDAYGCYGGIVLASGANYPDALVGASLCGRRNGLLVLVGSTVLSETRTVLEELGWTSDSLLTMGGVAAVTTVVESTVRSYIE